ncbi:beta-galactosidase [Streptomyces sp. CA-251387]|uniref:beta-galactosidase n=1 Tax=Streptomyces sp. CA-251387 TaxID=3240064 RepID=UPI003D8B3047
MTSCATPSATSPAARRAPSSSSGGSPGPAPRHGTRRWCRTRDPTAGSSARSRRPARRWPASASWRDRRCPRRWPSCTTRTPGGHSAWTACPRRSSNYHTALARAHRALWDAGVTVDFAHPAHELSRYSLVVAPALFLLSDKAAENLRRYVSGGGTLLVQHANGYVDERLHARLGGYPAAPLREALGIRVEEYRPLRRSERITLSDGTQGTVWSESLRTEGAETLAVYTHGMLTGSPALTRHRFGTGQGWYLSTHLDDADYGALVGRLLKEAGVEPELPGLPAGVEAVTRHASDSRRWHFLINHGTAAVPLPEPAHDLLTAALAHEVPPGGCAVLRGH